jgi:outer membrane protein assembly factor BamE (lipoprotein component of BamABCDE complex)
MKSFKKVLLLGMTLVTASIFGACSNDTDVLTKAGAKQQVKSEAEVLKGQKETPMTTSKRDSIKYENAISSQKRYISSDESKKIEEGMTYTDIINEIDYGGENLKHYNNNEKRVFYTEKDTDGTYEIMVELNTYGYVVNIERTAIRDADKENQLSTKRSEEPAKEYEEKNDRTPWYKDVNNDAAAVGYNEYLKIKKGIPANQVKATIGQPYIIEKYKSYSVYIYTGYDGEGSLRVIFEPNGTVTQVVEDGLQR